MADLDPTTCDPECNALCTREMPKGPARRTMLKGLAVAGIAVPFLAACGSSSGNGGSGSGDGGSTTDPTSDPPTGGAGADVITPAAAVAVDGGVILPDKKIVVTQPTKGSYEGFSSTCTHMQCTVGSIANGNIICPCHGSMYSIKDGSVVHGPTTQPLPKMPVKLDGSNIVSA